MIDGNAVLKCFTQNGSQALTLNELSQKLGVANKIHKRHLKRLVKQMVDGGELYQTKTGRITLPGQVGLVTGKLQGSPKGYGFVLPEKPGFTDIYINKRNLNGAMHGDRVAVKVYSHRGGGPTREGEVVRILARANKRFVGTFFAVKGKGYIVPDESRLGYEIEVTPSQIEAANGDKVVAEISVWPTAHRDPQGHILEVLGPKGAPGVDMLALCKKYGFEKEFSPAVLKEAAQRLNKTVDLKERRDLRDITTITIDGEDAKDLDDAVSLEMLSEGLFRLGVHIADVSYYVNEGSALDKEAYDRGTSVYLIDQVIPMLPKELSNDICSLNPHVDRLTMSIFMNINESGKITDYEIFPSVIKTIERMTYNAVRDILIKRDNALIIRYGSIVEMLYNMERLCRILYDKRIKRGAIDFDLPELKVVLDSAGFPVNLEKRERTIAEQIIEEFMIIANEMVATHLSHAGIPIIYRVHEEPSGEKVTLLNEFLYNYGIKVSTGGNGIKPKAFQDMLSAAKDMPERRLIHTLVLRSMKQAEYSPVNVGHFGLASPIYTHFTSPIRRYPDLVVHRILRESLQGGISPEREETLLEVTLRAAEHSSAMERNAIDAEREAVKMKAVEYMQDKVGEVFQGNISGVVSFGMFVELENMVEGLVPISSLEDDYYIYDERSHRLLGNRTKKQYRLGDTVSVQVVRVSISESTVDLKLV